MKLFRSQDPTIPTADQLTAHVHSKFGTAETIAASTADKLLGAALVAVGNSAGSRNTQFFRDGSDYGARITVDLTGNQRRTLGQGERAFRASSPDGADYFESQKKFREELGAALTERLTAALVTPAYGYSNVTASVTSEDRGHDDMAHFIAIRLEWTKP